MEIIADIPEPVRQFYEIDDEFFPLMKWIDDNPYLSPEDAEEEQIQNLWEDFLSRYIDYAPWGTTYYTPNGVKFAEV